MGGLPRIGTKLAKVFSRKGRYDGKIDDIEGIFPSCSAKNSKLFLQV